MKCLLQILSWVLDIKFSDIASDDEIIVWHVKFSEEVFKNMKGINWMKMRVLD